MRHKSRPAAPAELEKEIATMVQDRFGNRLVAPEIQYREGVLEVRGQCDSIETAQMILKEVMRYKGVRKIINQLTVVKPSG